MEAPRALRSVRVRAGAGGPRVGEGPRGLRTLSPAFQAQQPEARPGSGEREQGWGRRGLSIPPWLSNCAQPLTLYRTLGKSLIPPSLFRHGFGWDRELWKRARRWGAGAGRGSPGAQLTGLGPHTRRRGKGGGIYEARLVHSLLSPISLL